jgi:hypothetical protein
VFANPAGEAWHRRPRRNTLRLRLDQQSEVARVAATVQTDETWRELV